MRASVRYLVALGTLVSTACSADGQSQVEEAQQPIVRPTASGGKDQVVLLYMQVLTNGQFRTRTCSGAYIAPRVVLTAAHCLQNVWSNQVFAYWGNDFATDFSKLTQVGQTLIAPPPSAASVFAQADSYQVHPQWDANTVHPDLAIVFLDRKLPYQPLPIARFRLDASWVNKSAALVGWGANASLTADLSQTSGGRTQRTGATRILGSPTAADYHPEDPNPGILVPSIRKNELKTDGHAPYSNTCAGDSGSPLIVRKSNVDYVAGVSSWTGLWCEDYSLFARIDPFLPFVDQSVKRGGQAPVTPLLECVADNSDGTLSAYFGYNNENGVSVEVPYGCSNSMPLDLGNHRITKFSPGKHNFVFGVDFKRTQQLTYTLSTEQGPSTKVTATRNSPRCGSAVASQVACGGMCRAALMAGCTDILPSDSQCMSDCLSIDPSFPECAAQNLALNQCNAKTPPGLDHWLCNGDDFMPSSTDCSAQEQAFYACILGG